MNGDWVGPIVAALIASGLVQWVYGEYKTRKQARYDAAHKYQIAPAERDNIFVTTARSQFDLLERGQRVAEERARAAEKRAEIAERRARNAMDEVAELRREVENLRERCSELEAIVERRNTPRES